MQYILYMWHLKVCMVSLYILYISMYQIETTWQHEGDRIVLQQPESRFVLVKNSLKKNNPSGDGFPPGKVTIISWQFPKNLVLAFEFRHFKTPKSPKVMKTKHGPNHVFSLFPPIFDTFFSQQILKIHLRTDWHGVIYTVYLYLNNCKEQCVTHPAWKTWVPYFTDWETSNSTQVPICRIWRSFSYQKGRNVKPYCGWKKSCTIWDV